jgi:hypothetical protein
MLDLDDVVPNPFEFAGETLLEPLPFAIDRTRDDVVHDLPNHLSIDIEFAVQYASNLIELWFAECHSTTHYRCDIAISCTHSFKSPQEN